ncbi:MAG: DMT family transporter, partial [Candidatus Moraniibacteriota bacterium]
YNKGIQFAFLAAVISGFSVYINKFGVSFWANSDVYTTAKNIIAVVFLTAALFLWHKKDELKKLSLRMWLRLFAIGLIGGSLPFLLFFKALALMPASEAAFLQKTLFLWVALFSYPFLRERIGTLQVTALGVLFGGIYLLGAPNHWSFGTGFFLVLGATLLWAVENIIAKRVLETVSALIVGWARMFFGSILLIIWLVLSGEASSLVPTSSTQMLWALVVGIILFGYVSTWYTALKYAPATVVSSILTLAAPITLLTEGIARSTFPASVLFPLALMTCGVILLVTKFYRNEKSLDLKNPPVCS